MRKAVLLTVLLPFATMVGRAQRYADTAKVQAEQVITFIFRPANNVFYKAGNETELDRLYKLVDQYRAQIASGKMPVCVDGYSASQFTQKANLRTAFIRANRVKSQLITQKGLREENFVTNNHTTPLNGAKDVVVVTLRIPAQPQESAPTTPRTEPQPRPAKPEAKPAPAPPTEALLPAAKEHFPYCFAVRTNLLYDALLLPTLGVEWRVSKNVGVKVDGGYSYWGDKHGKVQKMRLVSPELRWYLGAAKRWYLGAGANFCDYNTYKYPVRHLLDGSFSDSYGRQGSLWSAGLTAGYQIRLNRSFSLDLNIGGGYASLDYDSFTVTDRVRVYEDKSTTKQAWGLTQAGVNLVWTIGRQK